MSTMHLNDVREALQRITELSNPKDYQRPLSDLSVSFRDKTMRCRWSPDDPVMRLTDVGASQLQQAILPGHFFKGLKQLVHMDEQGADLAGAVWKKFADRVTNTDLEVRTSLIKVASPKEPKGEVFRVVRSVVSSEYAKYSNLQFVEDIIENAGEYANLPVIDWWLTDNGMRIRFAAIDDPTYGLMHFDTSGTNHAPLPMIEVWNSETKCSKVVLRGGMYKLICSNGMCHWSAASEKTWIHRGSDERIKEGVAQAFKNLIRTANQVCSAYAEAVDIEVTNPIGWMSKQMVDEGVKNEGWIKEAVSALNDPTTTPGLNLASIVDAITLIAHARGRDMFDGKELEHVAARILDKGRTAAKANGGTIEFSE
jgi:hypothetical protein